MHEVDRARVYVHVSLDGRLLGSAAGELASTISAATLGSKQPVTASLQDGIVQVEEHCSDQDVSGATVPSIVEVGHISRFQSEREWLLSHVRIDEEQKNSRVEELHVEGDRGSLGEALGLSWESNPVDKHDADHTKDVVDTNEDVRKSGLPVVDLASQSIELVANRNIVGATSKNRSRIIILPTLVLAEALEGSGGLSALMGLNVIVVQARVLFEGVTVSLCDTFAVLRWEDGGNRS